MFDEPPKNLPVEPAQPSGGQAGEGPAPKPPMGSPPSMQGGIIPPKKGEPEDILSEIEAPHDETAPPAPQVPEAGGGGGKLKILIIILSAAAIVLILAIAGIFFYQRFIAVEPDMDEGVMMEDEMMEPLAPTTPTVPPAGPAAEEEEESPPVVPETPPPDIPGPEPVNSGRDRDNDGLSDTEEANLGTDPDTEDTDGDGLTDGDEVNVWLSNPTLADTDGDGYSDGDEVKNGYNPNGEGRLPKME